MLAFSHIPLAAFFGVASARIVGLAAPSVIAPNSEIPVTLITENYIQSVQDIAVAFSLSPTLTTNYLGAPYLGSFYLGSDKSNVIDNVTFTIKTPSDLTGIGFLNGAVTSLYGASYGPVSVVFHVPVTPGTTTSNDLNSDVGGTNSCSTTDTSSTAGGSTSTASGNTSRDATCFPDTGSGNVQTSIQSTQIAITNLINDVVQANNASALADLAKAKASLDQVTQTVIPPPDGCASIPTQPWPPLTPGDSQIRVEQILDSAQDALQALSAAILRCDVATAKSIVCQVQKLLGDAGAYWSS